MYAWVDEAAEFMSGITIGPGKMPGYIDIDRNEVVIYPTDYVSVRVQMAGVPFALMTTGEELDSFVKKILNKALGRGFGEDGNVS